MAPDPTEIEKAAAILRAGGLVAMPTETVYGLAADATNDRAVARIYEAKGRPSFNPLIVHVADLEMARRIADVPPLGERLAGLFWPGPLTLVLPRRADCGISHLVTAGLDTVALRSPAHPMARALLLATGRPLAAPSANPSGTISPTTAEHVREGLGAKVDCILDGGRCDVGIESTILKIDGDRVTLLRPGGVAREAIERVAGAPLLAPAVRIEAPGMLETHYAPRARLRLNVETPRADEAFIGFGAIDGDSAAERFNLSARGDLVEAAANLFARLHSADRAVSSLGLSGVAVAPIPREGLGEAINDRLRRAAAPKFDA